MDHVWWGMFVVVLVGYLLLVLLFSPLAFIGWLFGRMRLSAEPPGVRGGYQPTSDVDVSDPPQAGSGLR